MKEALSVCLHSLNNIQHYLRMMLTDVSYDPHVSTSNHIQKLEILCDEALESEQVKALDGEQPDLFPEYTGKIIISCDASIKNNPGGPSSCGVIIRFPGPKKPFELGRVLPTANTNNQAEYDAIYEGLNYFRTFGAGQNARSIEVRTDCMLAVNQLCGEWAVNDAKLKHQRDSILELVTELEEHLHLPVEITWYPRNSTEDLKKANYIAQDVLGVKNH
jgi:ribonuclease HI